MEGVFHNNFFKVNYDKNLLRRKHLVNYLSNPMVKEHLLLLAGTTTIPDLNHGDFLDTPFVVPPIDEQDEIIRYLEMRSKQIQILISNVELAIQVLNEYRTALISAAVTGKIDVREETA